jgi:hypothetical protein
VAKVGQDNREPEQLETITDDNAFIAFVSSEQLLNLG